LWYEMNSVFLRKMPGQTDSTEMVHNHEVQTIHCVDPQTRHVLLNQVVSQRVVTAFQELEVQEVAQ
jgi:hypothetical protein